MTAEERRRLRELEAAATPGPWFFNSYSTLFSAPLSKVHCEIEAKIPDDAPDEAYDVLPETRTAFVPTIAGDTATAQGRRDAALIAAARNALAPLLDALDAADARAADLEGQMAVLGGPLAADRRTLCNRQKDHAGACGQVVAVSRGRRP